MAVYLPDHLTMVEASGWWSLVHLKCSECGWRSFLAWDPICDRAELQRAANDHRHDRD